MHQQIFQNFPNWAISWNDQLYCDAEMEHIEKLITCLLHRKNVSRLRVVCVIESKSACQSLVYAAIKSLLLQIKRFFSLSLLDVYDLFRWSFGYRDRTPPNVWEKTVFAKKQKIRFMLRHAKRLKVSNKQISLRKGKKQHEKLLGLLIVAGL